MRIGVDLDNTIITYDALFRLLAEEGGFLADDGKRSKKEVRDAMWAENMHQDWTDIQALAYGPRINAASEFPGALAFFELCKAQGVDVCIISHKTEFAASDKDQSCNLREAALLWLEENGFFTDKTTLTRDKVSFAATRAEKVAMIADQGCDLFIDDLIEVYEEPGFPETCERILFTPSTPDKPEGFDGALCTHWQQMITRLQNGGLSWELQALVEAALDTPVKGASSIGGGRNSRVYCLDTDDGPYALKHYFDRHRLDAEFAAFAFLQMCGETQVPGPVAVDRISGFAVYDYIDGEVADPVTEQDLDDCVAFIARLKEATGSYGANGLGTAAEGFFCLKDIVNNIHTRFERLQGRERTSEQEGALASFLDKRFVPALDALSVRGVQMYEAMGFASEEEIPLHSRTLSPSDFGFHNALRTKTGMVFYDFEYFGWDDPAKLIADYLLHPGMTLSIEQREIFGRGVVEVINDSLLERRLAALLPLFGLKWVMILLNEFLKTDFERRKFAGSTEERTTVLKRQLAKAEAMLDRARQYAAHKPFGNQG